MKLVAEAQRQTLSFCLPWRFFCVVHFMLHGIMQVSAVQNDAGSEGKLKFYPVLAEECKPGFQTP